MAIYDAVILAGGTAARLGGVDKATLAVGGRTLLDRALTAASGARSVVVMGDPVPYRQIEASVRFLREDPPLAGPGAALLSGLEALRQLGPLGDVVVVGCDFPLVTSATHGRLLRAARTASPAKDGAVLTDPLGHWLLVSALHGERVLAVAPPLDERAGLPVHKLLRRLELVEVPAVDDEHRDVDTWSDVEDLGSR